MRDFFRDFEGYQVFFFVHLYLHLLSPKSFQLPLTVLSKICEYLHFYFKSFSTGTTSSPWPPPAPPRLHGHHCHHLFFSCKIRKYVFFVVCISLLDGGCDAPRTRGRRSWGSTKSGSFSERDARDRRGSPKESKGESKKSKASQDGQSGGGGVSLTFDRDVTYTPVGEPSDLFSREAGLYMWRTIPFDRMGWGKVPTPYKDTVMNHLKENFNFDEVEQYLEARDLKGGIRQVLMKRYSDRKNYAQREFRDNGGYDDVESARAHHPKDMPYDNWLRTIDHLLDPKYIARSEANTRVCQLQKFPNRRGTSSYSSTAYKNV
ncbi:uncharacterized protein LOC110902624 [Helianthus annuus]|uniref:uncharacterized protein LOC110902624 n=1 Tax=Helianthus annuus TaxID=4232 RepID=UPI001652DA05|nr:uncharacterized protein LOC110902624 [Helianthus annuus]